MSEDRTLDRAGARRLGGQGPLGRLALTALLLTLTGGPARAQEDGGSTLELLDSAPQGAGVLVLFVFDGETGAPRAGEALRVRGAETAEARVPADLGLRLVLPAGEYHLELLAPEVAAAPQPFGIAPGLSTELLVTVGPGGQLRVAAEQPAGTGAAGAAEDLGPPGLLEGVITEEADGSPVRGARIYVRGLDLEGLSDAEGRFSLELPPGEHELSVLKQGLATVSRAGLVVASGETTELSLSMVEAGIALDDFVVTAPRIEGGTAEALDERRQASTVSDILGGEAMSRAGDSSAGSALRRVTGLTLVGGKYVYVRGLGERYSSSLLNGSTLPSPEPERRVVPLDLFPTGLIDSIAVQKTFSPDMPAEFGGGTISIRTRRVPKEPLVSIGLSGSYLHGSTFVQGVDSYHSPTDWLGFGAADRALPPEVAAASRDEQIAEGDRFSDAGYSPEELESFGEAIDQRRWALGSRTLPPGFGVDVALGRGWQLGEEVRVGGLVASTFGNDWSRQTFTRQYRNLGEGGLLTDSHRYDFDVTELEVDWGNIANLGVELGSHTIENTAMLIRSSENLARQYQGFNADLGDDLRIVRTRWLERQLFYNQTSGTHAFPTLYEAELRWRATFAEAGRQEPDRREHRYDLEDPEAGLEYLSNRPGGNSMVYGELADRAWSWGVDLELPLPSWLDDRQGAVQVGLSNLRKERQSAVRRYYYRELSVTDEIRSQPIDEIFSEENVAPGQYQFEEATLSTDTYDANQQISAWYGMATLPIVGQLEVLTGVRQERSRQFVRTYERFNPDAEPLVATLETTDLLPALTLTQGLGRGPEGPPVQVRAGYGKTVSRPDFRELSEATFYDVVGGRLTYGNPDLARATIDNWDLRLEVYPGPGETVSVGAFYKYFDQPIESVVILAAQQELTFQNARSATDLGLEADFRKDLDLWAGAPFLADLYVAGNAAWIRSRVDLTGVEGSQTNDERPLEGQSPYVYNLQAGYDNPDSGSNISLLYNVFGPRIVQVGAQGAPDVRELPVHAMDLSVAQQLGAGVRLSLKWRNMLDSPRRVFEGEELLEEVRTGWGLSARLGWQL